MMILKREKDNLISDFTWFLDTYKILEKLLSGEWIYVEKLKDMVKEVYLASFITSLNYLLNKQLISSIIPSYTIFNLYTGQIKITRKGEKLFRKMEKKIIQTIKILED